jgi:protein translocase SecG subunit
MEAAIGMLPGAQIVLSVVLVALILLQRSGAELGGAFGGGDGGGGTLYTRRGAERVIFFTTIAVGVAFILVSLADYLLAP